MGDINQREDNCKYVDQMTARKKYQGTKIIKICNNKIDIGEQTPYEWILFKAFDVYAEEGVTVSCIEIEHSKEILDNVISTLTEREADVIKKRCGIEAGRKMSREEIAKLYGVNSNRIQQIEAKSLRKLRHPSRSGILLGKIPFGLERVENDDYLKRLKLNLLNEMVAMLSSTGKSFVYLDKICNRYNVKICSSETMSIEPSFTHIEKKCDVGDVIIKVSESNKLDDLGLSVRAYNCLKRAGINRIDQLVGLTDEELMNVRNLGKHCYEEVKECIRKLEINFEKVPISFLVDNSKTVILMINNQKIVYKFLGMVEQQTANSILAMLFNMKSSKRLIDMRISPELMEFLTMKGYLFWDDVLKDVSTLLEQLQMCQFNESVIELQELCEYERKKKEKVFLYQGRENIRNFIVDNKCETVHDIINQKDTDDVYVNEFLEHLKENFDI